ncbi:DUF4185 domain-containing protein [Streptomyces inhibens]|uniref:DUF4185 domain-containing protein n=1 Tax=Streptomyces inhibens TaxID=2293571 RepID=UPI00402A941B
MLNQASFDSSGATPIPCHWPGDNHTHVNTGDGEAIQLLRIQPNDFRDGNLGAQRNWAYVNNSWQWTTTAAPSAILSGNKVGEFSVKRIGNTYCMSYFDVDDYSICTRTAPRPDAAWTAPTPQIFGNNTRPASHWASRRPRTSTPGTSTPTAQAQRLPHPDRVAVERKAQRAALLGAAVRRHQPVLE